MDENRKQEEPASYQIIWILEEDYEDAMAVLKKDWEYVGEDISDDDEESYEDEVYVDDEHYAVVEYYNDCYGNSAEVYYHDIDKKEISDIRFWVRVDDDEEEWFLNKYEESNPGSESEIDCGCFCLEDDPYKSYLYWKILNRNE